MHVSEAGLEYLDEGEGVRFVDFEVCSRNAARQFPYRAAPQTVAQHRFRHGWPESNVLFIEFFTEPPTQFLFDQEQDFQRLRWWLEQMGWKTFEQL